jgi:hypothetical protein
LSVEESRLARRPPRKRREAAFTPRSETTIGTGLNSSKRDDIQTMDRQVFRAVVLRRNGTENRVKQMAHFVPNRCRIPIPSRHLLEQDEEYPMPHPQLTAQQQASVERLIRLAEGDSDQSRHIANFLLAWWNAKDCGGFDLTELWAVEPSIAADMVVVFSLIAGRHIYPDNLGYGEQFGQMVAAWRGTVKG